MSKQFTLSGTNLEKSFTVGSSKVRALANVDIDIHTGELVMLLGPSGAGKSTLLHVLSGLEKPDGGEVSINGRNLYSLSDDSLSRIRAETFGFIFQSYNLINTLTVLENVELQLHIANRSNARRLAQEMLERVGLAERMRHRPGQLSGGERQRVAIARALAAEPFVIFADEPTGNLDSNTGLEIIELLKSMVQEKSASCLMVTHNQSLAEVADRVLQLKDGRLEAIAL